MTFILQIDKLISLDTPQQTPTTIQPPISFNLGKLFTKVLKISKICTYIKTGKYDLEPFFFTIFIIFVEKLLFNFLSYSLIELYTCRVVYG